MSRFAVLEVPEHEPAKFHASFERPMARCEFSLNARMHHMTKAAHTRQWRAWAAENTTAFPFLGRVRVEVEWLVNDGRRRDEDNLVLILKAICDGVVDSGVVLDDTHKEMEKIMPRIVRVAGLQEKVLRVTLTQL